MAPPPSGAGHDGDDFLRPFTGHVPPTRPVPAPPSPPDAPAAEPQGAAVRPYSITRGRVTSADSRVRVETMVRAIPGGRHPDGSVPAGRLRALLAAARGAVSVAELAAAVDLPVAVALVLVGDLATDGLVELSTPTVARQDVALLRRLIDGVAAL